MKRAFQPFQSAAPVPTIEGVDGTQHQCSYCNVNLYLKTARNGKEFWTCACYSQGRKVWHGYHPQKQLDNIDGKKTKSDGEATKVPARVEKEDISAIKAELAEVRAENAALKAGQDLQNQKLDYLISCVNGAASE